ncbi:hypothetical protein, partial [Polaribacter reichenbachii]
MKTYYKILFSLFIFSFTQLHSQTNIKDYEKQWEGKLNDKNAFNFSVTLDLLSNSEYQFSLHNKNFKFTTKVKSSTKNYINI